MMTMHPANLGKLQEMVRDTCAAVHWVMKNWTGLDDWTTTKNKILNKWDAILKSVCMHIYVYFWNSKHG